MPNDQTASILIHIVDGTRQPLSNSVNWSARIHDGRSPSEWKMNTVEGNGPLELVKGLRFFDNFFDNYTVIVTANKFEDAAWRPINITPEKPASVNLMMLPKNGDLDFGGADWQALTTFRPRFAEILGIGAKSAATRYNNLTGKSPGHWVSAQPAHSHVTNCIAERQESARLLLGANLERAGVPDGAG